MEIFSLCKTGSGRFRRDRSGSEDRRTGARRCDTGRKTHLIHICTGDGSPLKRGSRRRGHSSSIGDESVKNSLKNCLAVGADYAYLAADDAYQNADPEVIAKELQAAKAEIEEKTGKKFDIVFCGKETTDFASDRLERSSQRSLTFR